MLSAAERAADLPLGIFIAVLHSSSNWSACVTNALNWRAAQPFEADISARAMVCLSYDTEFHTCSACSIPKPDHTPHKLIFFLPDFSQASEWNKSPV